MDFDALFFALRAAGGSHIDILEAFVEADPSVASRKPGASSESAEIRPAGIVIRKVGTLYSASVSPGDTPDKRPIVMEPLDRPGLVSALMARGYSPIDIWNALRACDPSVVRGW
jgi:hypothetical protein